ncbi:MAG: hypothetical protein JXQ79_00320 [Rhodobacteraceae bacterium]|nr:hypothetical protein [Paracoccaceae bacterium]
MNETSQLTGLGKAPSRLRMLKTPRPITGEISGPNLCDALRATAMVPLAAFV